MLFAGASAASAPAFAVGLAISVWAFETLCDARQWPHLNRKKPPTSLQPYLGLLTSILNEPKPAKADAPEADAPAADAKPKDIQTTFEHSQVRSMTTPGRR